MGDLFDVSAAAPPAKPAVPVSKPPPINYSAFNLSQPAPAPAPAKPTTTSAAFPVNVWDSNDAWATPDHAATPGPAPQQTAAISSTPAATPSALNPGWGEPAKPTTNTSSGFSVQQDEEFGGWSHASPVAQTPKAAGSNNDDLFGNVWG